MSAYDPHELVERWWGWHPMLLPALVQHGIDPVAAARRPLDEICAAAGLDTHAVLGALTAAEAPLTTSWQAASVAALIDHVLAAYHVPWPSLLAAAQVEHRGQRVQGTPAEAGRWREVDQLLTDLGADMADHLAKEERILFPWLRARAATAATPIRAMLLEHGDTLRLLARLRAAATAAGGAVVALDALIAGLCAHVHVENTLLFPRALDPAAR